MMLRAEGIVKNFGKLEVLKSVSVEVQQGEVVAIIGPSGSGKKYIFTLFELSGKSGCGNDCG